MTSLVLANVVTALVIFQLVSVLVAMGLGVEGLPNLEELSADTVEPIPEPELWTAYAFLGSTCIVAACFGLNLIGVVKWDIRSTLVKRVHLGLNTIASILFGTGAGLMLAETVNWAYAVYDYCHKPGTTTTPDLCISDIETRIFPNYDLALASGIVGFIPILITIAILLGAIYRRIFLSDSAEPQVVSLS